MARCVRTSDTKRSQVQSLEGKNLHLQIILWFYTQALTYTTYTYKHNKNKNVKYKISGTLIVQPNFSFGGGNTYMHHT